MHKAKMQQGPVLLPSYAIAMKPMPLFIRHYSLDFFKQISGRNEFDYRALHAFSCLPLFVSKLNDKRNNFFYKTNG